MIRQDAAGVVTVHVVPDPGADFDAVATAYRRALDDLAGRRVEVDVVQVDRVELSAGGKGRFLRSDYRWRDGEPLGGD
jgi:phenylacetate-CoA ligase